MSLCQHVDAKRGQCRRGAHSFGFHSYKPIAKQGRKAKRERASLDAARVVVKRRSEGWCEAHALLEQHALRREVCRTVLLHEGTNAHHLFPADRRAGVHDPARMLWLCDHAHPTFIHGNVGRAEQLGLLRPEVA